MKNHNVQKKLLNNFAIKEGDSYHISLIDLEKQRVGWRKTESIFYQKGLYPDELEHTLKVCIEDPGMAVIDKICSSKNAVMLSRRELEILKKYMLIQDYRNPRNIEKYNPERDDDIYKINKLQLSEGEGYHERVFRVMMEILKTPWDELRNSKEREIRDNVIAKTGCSTLILHTPDQFVINELGNVTERHRFDVLNTYSKEALDKTVQYLLEPYDAEPNEAKTIEFFKKHNYVDNFSLYPISSNYAVVFVNRWWTDYFKGRLTSEMIARLGFKSDFLMKYYQPCVCKYVNERKINRAHGTSISAEKDQRITKKIAEYTHPLDKYIYPIIELDHYWTAWLNLLTINESSQFVGCKVPEKLSHTIWLYNDSKESMALNHDLSWFKEDMDWSTPLN